MVFSPLLSSFLARVKWSSETKQKKKAAWASVSCLHGTRTQAAGKSLRKTDLVISSTLTTMYCAQCYFGEGHVSLQSHPSGNVGLLSSLGLGLCLATSADMLSSFCDGRPELSLSLSLTAAGPVASCLPLPSCHTRPSCPTEYFMTVGHGWSSNYQRAVVGDAGVTDGVLTAGEWTPFDILQQKNTEPSG